MNNPASSPHMLDIVNDLIKRAKNAGADAADAVYFAGKSESVSWRLGKLEDIERSENSDLGLRVMVAQGQGQKQAIVSSSDMSSRSLDQLVEHAIDMAKNAPEDPYAGLADQSMLHVGPLPELDLLDNTVISGAELKEMARETEESALAIEGITNSEGAGASTSQGQIALATSDGFAQSYQTSNFSLSVSVIAGENDSMERDYAYSSKRHFSDLECAETLGREAAEKALSRMGSRKMDTCEVPIIFDPRVSRTLLGHLAGAINGQSIARGTSFLKDRMDQEIFSRDINIIDDPHIIRGPSSRPFDAEGCRNQRLNIIKDGILHNWTLDSSSARQLGLTSNGRASRGTSSPPSPSSTNLYMTAGELSPEDLMKDIKNGLYVTDLIGMGVNGITGDYSRGAGGFWIEDGKISFPVNEITIAGNLKDMFKNLTAASDLEIKYGTDAPTIRIESMMIAGS